MVNQVLTRSHIVSHFEASHGIDPDEWGYRAWHADQKLSANPFWPESEEWEMWRKGWMQARAENSQFGMGA
jgi:hypothetical protein